MGDHEQRLRHEATHDPLTGLANRTLFSERLAAALNGPSGEAFSLVVVDLDGFKAVNDTLGHAVGDALLVSVAQRLRAGIRASDTVARLGGDEFAILVEGQGADDVEPMVERIVESLRTAVGTNGHTVVARASFGVVEGRSGEDADALMHQADVAMYEAKAHGAGVRRYQVGMEARDATGRRFADELRSAIAEHQLVLHYQPIATLPEGQLTGVEALVRWQHPTRGLLMPADFIPAAEETA